MPVSARHAQAAGRTARVFFVLAVAVLLVSAFCAWSLMYLFGRLATRDRLIFPPVFLISSLLLLAGSITLSLAVRSIRQERQVEFRSWLTWGLICASLFMGTQFYGLWSMFPTNRQAADASLGVLSFVFALTTLHVAHFFVASLFVCFVTAQAVSGRYDHEYYWGVKVCAWFWHALGIVWLAILFVFTIVI